MLNANKPQFAAHAHKCTQVHTQTRTHTVRGVRTKWRRRLCYKWKNCVHPFRRARKNNKEQQKRKQTQLVFICRTVGPIAGYPFWWGTKLYAMHINRNARKSFHKAAERGLGKGSYKRETESVQRVRIARKRVTTHAHGPRSSCVAQVSRRWLRHLFRRRRMEFGTGSATLICSLPAPRQVG